MEFDKTRWSCPWNSDQNCTQNYARGSGGVRVWGVLGSREYQGCRRCQGSRGVGGVWGLGSIRDVGGFRGLGALVSMVCQVCLRV